MSQASLPDGPVPQRPNLLFITTDQQRFDTIHAHGNPGIYTPHLNWLSDTGISFRRAYSDAPICVPARATMITGLPFYQACPGYGTWGHPTAPNRHDTLPGRLSAAGYQTRSVGKLHFHPPRCSYGFEHIEILEDYYREKRRYGISTAMEHGLGQNEMEPLPSFGSGSDSLTHWIAERAVNFIETRDTTRPFFLHLGFSKPHPPLDPPAAFWELYRNRAMRPPVYGDWSAHVDDIPRGMLESTLTLNRAERFAPGQLVDIKRAYYACISQIDYNLGLLFARLRELKLLDRTLILFTSDHGEMLGDHHLGGKSVFLEGSAHIPMIVRPPFKLDRFSHFREGVQCDGIVTLADIMPTFLDAANIANPGAASLLDFVGNRSLQREFFGALQEPPGIENSRCHQFAVISGNWKYLLSGDDDRELLFDLGSDPMEQRDLSALEPRRCKNARKALIDKITRYENWRLDPASGKLLPTCAGLKDVPVLRRSRAPGFHSANTRADVLH